MRTFRLKLREPSRGSELALDTLSRASAFSLWVKLIISSSELTRAEALFFHSGSSFFVNMLDIYTGELVEISYMELKGSMVEKTES